MNVLFWNIRGIGNDISKKMLRWHCNTIRPDLLCLAEPKVPLENIHSSFWSSIQMNFVALNSRVSGLPKKRVLRSHKVSLINIIYRSEQVIVLELESCSRRFSLISPLCMHMLPTCKDGFYGPIFIGLISAASW